MKRSGVESGRKLQRCFESFFFPQDADADEKDEDEQGPQKKRDIPQWAEIDIRLFIFRHCKAHFTDKS